MKLSEQIRLGAMLKPQAFGMLRRPVDWPPVLGDVLGLRATEGTCAYGAAMDAGYVGAAIDYVAAACPVRGHDYCTHVVRPYVMSVVMHLNDHHRWTREAIADWVETIEAQHEAASEPPLAIEPAIV